MTWVSVAFRSTEGRAWLSRERFSGIPPPQPTRAAASQVTPAMAKSLGRMRFVPGGIGSGQHRHADAEVGARIFAVDDLDGAAVCVDELEHHGQADARTFHLHPGRRPPGVESFEYAGAFVRRDAGPGVGDVDHELGVLFRAL